MWPSKRPHYSAALDRLSTARIMQLIQLIAQAEVVSKTQYETSAWPLLHQLSVEMCLPQVKLEKAQNRSERLTLLTRQAILSHSLSFSKYAI
ncbi:hypothetical protein QWZ16_16655 [Vibrio ostreicida]|uniref:DNA polymerase III subunit delta C-terminal domain-containing protein n=1 Tax=Vibrio ostreicida TaxID=526588 RepID=A0ABT8BYW6_9VIBR|nr:hypothetical protein [Vibrio ostreicida]MDN3611240.1 hypothetical protein [Vibrio ostreicida]